MRDRATTLAVALGLAVAAFACSGGQEKNVVNNYFNALKANDTNTLTSFAMVQFEQPVQDWKIVSIGPDTTTPAPLPELVKKQTDAEAQQKANEREYRAWANDLAIYPKIEQMRAIDQKNGAMPPALVPIQQKWAGFQAKDRELKKAIASAKAAVEREKRNVTLSVGQVEGLEAMAGQMTTKDIEVALTINGETKAYVMTIRRYQLDGGSGPRMVSRWVVETITPKS
jgi:hypothetical protein